MPEEVVSVRDVKAVQTRSGKTRFVLIDEQGREFSTFREQIAAGLAPLSGHRARIVYHEEQRGGFTNVYLDRVEPLVDGEDPQAAEAAWQMAIEAAPYLLGKEAAEAETSPEELFDKLKPFKDLVADDLDQEATADDADH